MQGRVDAGAEAFAPLAPWLLPFQPLLVCSASRLATVQVCSHHCVSVSSLLFFARKARGEAKKCRKVYGIEHRDQWCTACRWKKACQRFLD